MVKRASLVKSLAASGLIAASAPSVGDDKYVGLNFNLEGFETPTISLSAGNRNDLGDLVGLTAKIDPNSTTYSMNLGSNRIGHSSAEENKYGTNIHEMFGRGTVEIPMYSNSEDMNKMGFLNTDLTTKQKVGIGVGVAAVAAGAYFLSKDDDNSSNTQEPVTEEPTTEEPVDGNECPPGANPLPSGGCD